MRHKKYTPGKAERRRHVMQATMAQAANEVITKAG